MAVLAPVNRPRSYAISASQSPPPTRPVATAVAASKISALVIAWENVLFPAKWLSDCVGLSASKKSVEEGKAKSQSNPFLAQALEAIERQAIDLLATASTSMPVYITTEHPMPVFEAMCSAFFPRLKSCLATSANRVQVVATPNASLSSSQRSQWKLSVFQQVCTSAAQRAQSNSGAGGFARFQVVSISTDETDLQAASLVHERLAQYGTVQPVPLQAATSEGKPVSLVDFFHRLSSITSTLQRV
ncbi:hypothetical protein PINS_up023887 [Pythium insidiosum]|nr:hypothetical protein PINS_up023887 [Pythium insidiosum]